MARKRNKIYFLIRNKKGQCSYSNKGFVNTPHYISEATVKYRVKELVEGAVRWFDPAEKYQVDQARELRDVTVTVYNFDSHPEGGGMMREPAMPVMDLVDFCQTYNMQDVADKLKNLLAQVK